MGNESSSQSNVEDKRKDKSLKKHASFEPDLIDPVADNDASARMNSNSIPKGLNFNMNSMINPSRTHNTLIADPFPSITMNNSSGGYGDNWTRPSQLNEPTEEGFKVFIRTQFGNDITVYGLSEDSTMLDIEKRIEVTHGSSSMKTGMIISQYTAPPDGIPEDQWGFKKDLKLKDLGIKPNDIVIWSTAYSKTQAMISEKVSDECNMKDAHHFKQKVSIDKLLKADSEELILCGALLEKRGWCLVEYPDVLKKVVDSVCALVNEEMVREDKKWGKIGDEYGYLQFKDYKEVLRVVTGTLMDKYGDQYPKKLQDGLKTFCRAIDRLTVDLIKVFATNDRVFGFESVDDFVSKSKEEECNVTILSGYNKEESEGMKCGLLDFVHYKNIDGKQEESEYPMIKERAENVGAHTDPGLFSLSFMSTAPGLQLYDKDCWRVIENDCGVLWCGEAAPKISSGKIKAGIHRVIFSGDQPRFTSWYEASVDAQLTKAIVE